MHRPGPSAQTLPLHVLFPEEYAASKRMIAQDFTLIAGTITVAIVGLATLATLV